MAEAQLLVDTSVWIEGLRSDGDRAARARLAGLLAEDRVVFCDMVLLELWNGARGTRERRVLAAYERAVTNLVVDAAAWRLSTGLARRCRTRGLTVPATDLIIAACALRHGAEVWSLDADLTRIMELAKRPE